MNSRLLIFTICISALYLVFSCVKESEELVIEDVLPGYWELISATRNGSSVPSLQGAYFEFDTLGAISTNFSGEQVLTDYTINDNSILYTDSGTETKMDFQIKTADTLIFKTEMRKIFKFELTLLRSDKNQ